jgi:hypothetical protein
MVRQLWTVMTYGRYYTHMLALVDTGWDLMSDLPNIIKKLHSSTNHSFINISLKIRCFINISNISVLESRWDYKRSEAEKLKLLRVFIFWASSGTLIVIHGSSLNQTVTINLNIPMPPKTITHSSYSKKLKTQTI